MNPSLTGRPRRNARPAGVALLSLLVLAALAAVLSGCGSKSSDTPAAGATPTAIQVMATATRGDLTQSTMGTAKVTKSGGRLLVVATIDAQNASSVAEGQTAIVFFLRGGGSFPQAGQSGVPQPQGSGMPQGAPSGMPQPQGSGMPQPQGSGSPVPQGGQGGQGGFPGGQGGFPGGQRGGTAGTVTAVTTNSDGSAAATISVDKLPSGVKNGSSGFARIEVKVLASNVVLIPTAAVKGSGSSATVQVSANGTTETRTVTAGQQSGGMTEIVSGLNEGENVVYSQAFRGFPGRGQSGAPFPQGGQSGVPFPQQSGQSGGSF